MTHDELRAAIRGAGLRATLQRIAVLRVVVDSATPLSHGDISDRMRARHQERSTVYRNLLDLARAGLVHRVNHGDRTWRFERAANTSHARRHPHFVCTGCGTISCLPGMKLVGRAERTLGEVEVHVRGLCDACARR
ncbi:MAG TPA: Fur family transcriptional regulator [Kofleriaceae bacterium]